MQTIILGAHGQLGHAFCQRLGPTALGLGRERADLTRPAELRKLLGELRPQTVINCAAYNFVDRAEKHPLEAMEVNLAGTASLARTCAELDCLLLHFSTDHVFGQDRQRKSPYTEDGMPGPVNVYGHSKLGGEYAVRSLCPLHFIVRTCGLYGQAGSTGKRGNFVDTMLRLGREEPRVKVVEDQICTPTFVDDLVEASLNLLTTQCHGVYHLTNAGSCSWLEFARTIFSLAGVAAEAVGVTSAVLARSAQRPGYSVLDGGRYGNLGFPAMRPWQAALQSYLLK
jgi:dTDP-4-dehydrorhamnose reductase